MAAKADDLVYVGALVVKVCWCGIRHAVPSELAWQIENKNKSAYCPLGHEYVARGETEAERLKRDLEWTKDELAASRARADGAEASLRTTKGHVTRLRKQVLAGQCPLCGQHLRDLARHISRRHPDEPAELA